ncbi:MAG: hypothetical protein ACRENE_34825 [Polyangiaceae bacterium]
MATAMAQENATAIVREALSGTGIEVVASCGIEAYDARAPADYHSSRFLSGARGLVVAASAGPRLWRRFLERMKSGQGSWGEPHPYDAFVGELLSRGDEALAAKGVKFVRFEARFGAPVPVNFVALGELAGLGAAGPFGLLIHPTYGPWWALRGAWLVDAGVEPRVDRRAACEGCPAPCVGGWQNAGSEILLASPDARRRCIVGPEWRYDEDQLAYHYAREDTVRRLQG